MDIKELKRKAQELGPMLRIGKAGITQGVVDEIKLQLKKRRLLKIKILKAVFEQYGRDEVVDDIVQKTGATLVNSIGHVVTLYK